MHAMLSATHPFQHGCSIHCVYGFLQNQPVYLYHLQSKLCAEAFDNGAGTAGVENMGIPHCVRSYNEIWYFAVLSGCICNVQRFAFGSLLSVASWPTESLLVQAFWKPGINILMATK